MIIYFIRHGETQSNKEHRITGHVDSLLTEDGIAQAEKAALEIASDFSEIYSSDLIRCKDTSAILNKKLNIPITYDSRLRERSFGSLEGKTWNDIEGSDVLKKLDKTQSYDYRPYGGESVDDVKERVLSFIDDIRNTKRDKKILVVSSGGVIRLLHNILHGEAPGVIHNSSVHKFEFED